MYVPYQGQLALISTGRTSGMVLDSGDGIPEFSAILTILIEPKSVNLSSKDLTDYLLDVLIIKRNNYSQIL
jgi:actin